MRKMFKRGPAALRPMRLFATRFVIFALLLAGCTVNVGTSSQVAQTTKTEATSEEPESAAETSRPVLDPSPAWESVGFEVNALAQSEIAYTANGIFGLLATPELRLFQYIDGVWSDVPGDDLSQLDPLGRIGLEIGSLDYDVTIQSVDLTGDDSVEFIIRFRPAPWDVIDAPNQGRNFGSVLTCDGGDCRSLPFWEPPEYSDGGREHFTVEYIEWIDATLFASWYGTCGRPCGLLIYEWVPAYGRLEGKEASERQKKETERLNCIDFQFNFDLPLQLCDEGMPVEYVQGELQASGYGVDADGYLGIDTQLAVKLYQKERGIRATGIVDLATWTEMFKGDTLPGRDLNNDGVITPNELSGT